MGTLALQNESRAVAVRILNVLLLIPIQMQYTYFFRPPLPLSPVLPLFGAESAAVDLEVPALAGPAEVAAAAAVSAAAAAAAAAASFSVHRNTNKFSVKKMIYNCSVMQCLLWYLVEVLQASSCTDRAVGCERLPISRI